MTVRQSLSVLALLGLVALAGCSSSPATAQTTTPTVTATQTSAAPTPTPTPAGPSLQLTYIGSDGNVYEMAWPGGTPQQWTTKAQPNKVTYTGLVWSPDGSKLAVLRLTGPTYSPTGVALIEFSSTGNVLNTFTLPSNPYNTPFVWSPDSSEIAYRTSANQVEGNGDIEGRLTVIDASTGAIKESFLYDAGGGGCGGGGFPAMTIAIEQVRGGAYMNPDTFAWTPGQQSILVSRGCGNDSAELVNLTTQQVATQYPGSASYQPNGSFILGEWYGANTISLGLANLNAAEHAILTTAPDQSNGYSTTLGVASWSPDGQTVYYEHNNGIWAVGADGTNAHQVVAGAPNDAQNNATVQVMPSVSSDGSLLLYVQLQGSNTIGGTVHFQCYVAHTDGSNATALPSGASQAVWRP